MDEINFQDVYQMGDLIDMDYPPKIVIDIERIPKSLHAEPLVLSVDGLSKEFVIVLKPGVIS